MAANINLSIATHAMTALAYTGKLTTSDMLANGINVNPVVVRKLLSKLVKAGLVHSEPGKNGGFMLGRPSNKISLWDIASAIDDINVFAIHSYPEQKCCPVSCNIKSVLNDVFAGIDQGVAKALKKIRLDQITQQM